MTLSIRMAGLAALLPLPLAAATTTVDYSDLWFNPSESGWGANVIQQGDTLFATFFLYGPNGQPVWYVASSVVRSGSGANHTFTGPLYRTTGPYFGSSSFTPAVNVTPVGTVTFSASQPSMATLSYNVDGAVVTKTVFRQTWDREDIGGNYLGGSAGSWSSCGGTRNGYQEATASYVITQDGPIVQVREEGPGFTCTYTGQYTQSGRLGAIAGGGLCSDGINHTFSGSEIQVTPVGIQMRVEVNEPSSCRFVGRIAAVRRGS